MALLVACPYFTMAAFCLEIGRKNPSTGRKVGSFGRFRVAGFPRIAILPSNGHENRQR